MELFTQLFTWNFWKQPFFEYGIYAAMVGVAALAVAGFWLIWSLITQWLRMMLGVSRPKSARSFTIISSRLERAHASDRAPDKTDRAPATPLLTLDSIQRFLALHDWAPAGSNTWIDVSPEPRRRVIGRVHWTRALEIQIPRVDHIDGLDRSSQFLVKAAGCELVAEGWNEIGRSGCWRPPADRTRELAQYMLDHRDQSIADPDSFDFGWLPWVTALEMQFEWSRHGSSLAIEDYAVELAQGDAASVAAHPVQPQPVRAGSPLEFPRAASTASGSETFSSGSRRVSPGMTAGASITAGASTK